MMRDLYLRTGIMLKRTSNCLRHFASRIRAAIELKEVQASLPIVVLILALLFFESHIITVGLYGDRNPITAAQPILRPNTPHCRVVLVGNLTFEGSSSNVTTHYSRPVGCPSPWSMVVLDWNATLSGTPYDRVGAVWVDGVEVFRTSTPIPPSIQISWHVEKDLSEYIPILENPAVVFVYLPNPVSQSGSGPIEVTASFTFYESNGQFKPAFHPNIVLPVSSGIGPQWFSITPSSPYSQPVGLTIPANADRVSLEVYATGQGNDEFWYSSFPTSYAASHGLNGGTSFREIQVFLDGRIAGVVWPFPLIYAGLSDPSLWRPIPGVNTFDIPPYSLDMSPFVGSLNDGNSHNIGFSVANNNNYWRVDGNLLVYEDPGQTADPGGILNYSIQPNSSETVTQNQVRGVTVFTTHASRTINVTGYADTSFGRVVTSIQQTLTFTSTESFGYLLIKPVESIRNSEVIDTLLSTRGANGSTIERIIQAYPLTVVSFPGEIDQAFTSTDELFVNGTLIRMTSLSDSVSAIAPWMTTTEHYEFKDSSGNCYNHMLAASQQYLSSETLTSTC